MSWSAVDVRQRVAKTVLLVAAEPFVRDLIAMQLRAAGCYPMPVATAAEGQRLAAQLVPDLIVVDLDDSPSREADWAVQVARGTAGKSVRTAMLCSDMQRMCGDDGSRCGANLCVPKPFDPRDLMGELLRLLRSPRTEERHPRPPAPLQAALIELDLRQPTVRLRSPDGWQTLDLPWTEHRLLACLLGDAERVRSREEIRDAVWHDTPVDLRTVDQYVRRLRRTLEARGARELVKTVKGFGYRLDLGALEAPKAGPVARAGP